MTSNSPRSTLAVVSTLFALVFPLREVSADAPLAWASRGIGGGGALYSPAINPANEDEIYIGCDMSGLYHSTNFGASYETVNFASVEGGHGSAVRFTSNPLIRYCLSYSGDVPTAVKSTDGGASWQPLADNPLPYDEIFSLFADYDHPGWVFVTSYSEIYFSSDGGDSFENIGLSFDSGNGVVIGGEFSDGNHIYLGTNGGLVVSDNAGASFRNAGTPGIPADQYLYSFAAAKVGGTLRFYGLTGANVYAGLEPSGDYWGFTRGIYRLDDPAGSWKSAGSIDFDTNFPMFLGMAANNLDVVYAAGGSADGVPIVLKSVNGGTSWTNVFRATGNANVATGWSGEGGDRGWGYGEVFIGLAVARLDANRALVTDMGFAHGTTDGGASWRQAYVNRGSENAAGDTTISNESYRGCGLENTSCWQLFWCDKDTLFAAFADIRGIRSTDGGRTWSFHYTGYTGNTIYRIVQHPESGVLYAAASNVHDLYASTRLADSLLDAADANGKILYSTDKGATWKTLHSFGHPVFWVCLDPTNPKRLYASVVSSTAGGVYASDNIDLGASSTWVKLAAPTRTEGHPACLVVLSDGRLLCTYSGRRTNSGFTASSGLFRYDPTAKTWTDLSAPGMKYWSKDVVVDPSDATQKTYYVCVFSGWGGAPNGLGGLYRSRDAGTTWTRINALDRVTCLTIHPGNRREAYLTTETEGLWYTQDITATTPVFTLVSSYPFRQPERVFFNPYDPDEVWVTSFGNGLRVGLRTRLPEGFHCSVSPDTNPSRVRVSFGPVNPDLDYLVEWSENLLGDSWKTLTPQAQEDSGTEHTDLDTSGTVPRFYRVKAVLP